MEQADQEQCLSITDVLSGAQAVGRGLESLRTQNEELFSRVMNAMPVEEDEEGGPDCLYIKCIINNYKYFYNRG